MQHDNTLSITIYEPGNVHTTPPVGILQRVINIPNKKGISTEAISMDTTEALKLYRSLRDILKHHVAID